MVPGRLLKLAYLSVSVIISRYSDFKESHLQLVISRYTFTAARFLESVPNNLQDNEWSVISDRACSWEFYSTSVSQRPFSLGVEQVECWIVFFQYPTPFSKCPFRGREQSKRFIPFRCNKHHQSLSHTRTTVVLGFLWTPIVSQNRKRWWIQTGNNF